MNGCSLDDAFQSPDGAPSPGCMGDEGARHARKEERRKARARTKLVAPTGAPGKDPDRQHLNPLPDVPAMRGSGENGENGEKKETEENEETFDHYVTTREHNLHQKPANHNSASSYKYHKGPLEQYSRDEERLHYMVMPIDGHSVVAPKKFFGAQGPTDEPYADYLPDTASYRLEPDFSQAFQGQGSGRSNPTNSLSSSSASSASSVSSASSSLSSFSSSLSPPALDMYWKPLIQSGAQTSFIENPLPPSGKYHSSSPSSRPTRPGSSDSLAPFHRSLRSAYENGEISPGELMNKLDMLFAKLEDIQYRSTPEQITSEMLMFISSGVFVLFLMDLLVKRGGSMRF